MKRLTALFLILLLLLTGCQSAEPAPEQPKDPVFAPVSTEGTQIVLRDDGITVDGEAISSDDTRAVYAAHDIVYYPTGQDFTFGEGTAADAHDADEADGHTVVHIAAAGTYVLTGSLSAGQVAIDLGKDAKKDPNAVVTLILNGVDITCSVAPAVIFYNVYECGDQDTGSKTVDTFAAGANVLLADNTVNNIHGAYVAKIYKPDSVVLSKDGSEVEDAKKLHKYDGAFYSKMSMNIGGNDGVLNIRAENEGLDSELHLTINGGEINIYSGNDGINTNEDGVSVTTVNGGRLTIQVNGETGEGDGIDSNGWLVINGGTVSAAACSFSADSGIDSDMGIYINGGTVVATGNMLDQIAGGDQTYAVFSFASKQAGGGTYTLKDAAGNTVIELAAVNDFTNLIVAGDQLTPGDYTFWHGAQQLEAMAGQGFGGGMMPGGQGFGGGRMPGGQQPNGGFPEGQMPEGFDPTEGQFPEGFDPQDGQFPEGFTPPEGAPGAYPGGQEGFGGGRGPNGQSGQTGELSSTFTIAEGANYFSLVTVSARTL